MSALKQEREQEQQKATSESAYITAVSNLLKCYLKDLPEEAERMPVLLQQLEQNDCSLTDRKNMVGHLTASALVIKESQVLLIHHNGLKRWLQPGGHLDHNEEPEAGARRELLEETGLGSLQEIELIHSPYSSQTKTLPFDVDTHDIPANPAKNEGEHRHHDFQYLYRLDGQKAQAIVLQEEEVGKYKWVTFEQLESGDYGRRLRRVAAKLKALPG